MSLLCECSKDRSEPFLASCSCFDTKQTKQATFDLSGVSVTQIQDVACARRNRHGRLRTWMIAQCSYTNGNFAFNIRFWANLDAVGHFLWARPQWVWVRPVPKLTTMYTLGGARQAPIKETTCGCCRRLRTWVSGT